MARNTKNTKKEIQVISEEKQEHFVPEFEEKQEHFVPEFEEITESETEEWIPKDDFDEIPVQDDEKHMVQDNIPATEHIEALKEDIEIDYLEKAGFKRAAEGDPKVRVVCNINGHNVSNECRISMAPNPKRVGSKAHERYSDYESATTIGEYLEAGGLKADLRFDHNKGYLELKDHIVGGMMVAITPKAK